jgi:hypothetical protein
VGVLVTGCVVPAQSVPPAAAVADDTETQQELAADFAAQATQEVSTSAPEQVDAPPAALNPDSLRSYLSKTEIRIDALTPEERLLAWTTVEARTDKDAPSPVTGMKIVDRSLSEEGASSEVILAADDVFLRTPTDQKWLRFSRSGSATILPNMLTPDEIAASSADLLGQATVLATDEDLSGIATTHYQLTGDALATIAEQSLPRGSHLISGQMDFWVAPAGYIKQVIQEFIAEDAAGAQTRHSLTMLVLEENLPQDLSLPAASDVTELDLPEPPTQEPINTEATPAS